MKTQKIFAISVIASALLVSGTAKGFGLPPLPSPPLGGGIPGTTLASLVGSLPANTHFGVMFNGFPLQTGYNLNSTLELIYDNSYTSSVGVTTYFPLISESLGNIETNSGKIIDVANDTESMVETIEKIGTTISRVDSLYNQPAVDDIIISGLQGIEPLFALTRQHAAAALGNRANHPNLTELLSGMENLVNTLKVDLGHDVDLNVLKQILAALPEEAKAVTGQALFLSGIDQNFVTHLTNASSGAQLLLAVIATNSTSNVTQNLFGERFACTDLDSQSELIDNSATDAILLASAMKFLGGVLAALGETTPTSGPEVELGLLAEVKVKVNVVKSLGLIFDSMSDSMVTVAEAAKDKVSDCNLDKTHETIMASLEAIEEDTTNANSTLDFVKNKVIALPAIQTSTDLIPAINGKVDTILANTDQTLTYTSALPGIGNQINIIESNVITLPAIQASTDQIPAIGGEVSSILGYSAAIPGLTSELAAVKGSVESNSAALSYVVDLLNRSPGLGLGGGVPSNANPDSEKNPSNEPTTTAQVNDANASAETPNLWLRVQIEQSLLNVNQTGPAIFYRPESLGGHLELVREIVNNTIEQNINGGYTVGTALERLAEGDSYLISGYYKEAWQAFGFAYREAL